MARRPKLKGNPNELVLMQLKVPLRLKQLGVKAAERETKDLSTWVRGLMIAELKRLGLYHEDDKKPPQEE